jgi:hypothetical protein
MFRAPFLSLLAAGSLVLAGCSKQESGSAPAPEASGGARGMSSTRPPGETPPAGTPNAAAGLTWTIPPGWSVDAERAMRVATYGVPAASGDAEGGECGVFHFGPSQGGDVESNIARWVAQFESPGTPERSGRVVDGMRVSLVKVSGTYLAPGGPMMQSTGSKPDYALLGAIVEGPQGSVFFKLTGPRRTLEAAARDFDAMVASVKRS